MITIGTDIHCYCEYKNKETDKWVLANPVFPNYQYSEEGWLQKDGCFTNCNYNLFSYLAGVRGMHDAIKDPCGVPSDMSDALQEVWDEEKEWSHTPTWYTMKELRDAVDEAEKEYDAEDYDDYYFSPECLWRFYTLMDYIFDMNGIYYNGDDCRVVMWFDS